jgi:hypothetical protein
LEALLTLPFFTAGHLQNTFSNGLQQAALALCL